MSKIISKIEQVIRSSDVSLIGSIDRNGYPNIKAMLKPREHHSIYDFYFSTNTSSIRVDQFTNISKACLYFYDKNSFQGVMLIGNMEIITDQAIKTKIWQDGDEIYYQKGINDCDYCVLKFTTISCRYYHDFISEEIILKNIST